MQGDGEELLVTIAPLASATVPAEAEYRPWLGVMLMIGLPVLLAIVAFVLLVLVV